MAKEFNPNDHLMDLKGKSYLQVAHRLLWLNEDVKAGIIGSFEIQSELMERRQWTNTKTNREINEAVFRATIEIFDPSGEPIKKVSGWGSETDVDFGDYLEKAETKSIGRAIALAGYGTQHAPEFDEGERSSPFLDADGNRGPIEPAVADAPVKIARAASGKAPPVAAKPRPQRPPVVSSEKSTPEPAPVKEATPSPVEPVEPGAPEAPDKKTEIITWLQHAVNHPDKGTQIGTLIKEQMAGQAKGSKVSDLPAEQLQALFNTASALLRSGLPN